MLRRPERITAKRRWRSQTITLHYTSPLSTAEVDELSAMLEIAPDMWELTKRVLEPARSGFVNAIQVMAVKIVDKVRPRLDVW